MKEINMHNNHNFIHKCLWIRVIHTSTERPEALDKACFFIAGIDEVSLLQAVDTAVQMNQNGDYGIPINNTSLCFYDAGR
jgi:UDP-N-acetylglucosamine 2-epimerase